MAIPERTEEVEQPAKAWLKKTTILQVKATKSGQVGMTATRPLRLPFEEKTNKVIKEHVSPPIKKMEEKVKKPQGGQVLQLGPKRGHVKHSSTIK